MRCTAFCHDFTLNGMTDLATCGCCGPRHASTCCRPVCMTSQCSHELLCRIWLYGIKAAAGGTLRAYGEHLPSRHSRHPLRCAGRPGGAARRPPVLPQPMSSLVEPCRPAAPYERRQGHCGLLVLALDCRDGCAALPPIRHQTKQRERPESARPSHSDAASMTTAGSAASRLERVP